MYVNHSPRGLEETLLTNRYEQLTRSPPLPHRKAARFTYT